MGGIGDEVSAVPIAGSSSGIQNGGAPFFDSAAPIGAVVVKVRLRYIYKGEDFGNWSDWKTYTLWGELRTRAHLPAPLLIEIRLSLCVRTTDALHALGKDTRKQRQITRNTFMKTRTLNHLSAQWALSRRFRTPRTVSAMPNNIMKLTTVLILACLGTLVHVANANPPNWQAIATKHYPELARQGSEFNKRFVDAYNSAKNANSSVLRDPRWPLTIAEEVADQGSSINASKASLDEIELAIKTKDLDRIMQACASYTSRSKTVREQLAALGEKVGTSMQTVKTAQAKRQAVEPEIQRLRRNAATANRPNPLNPGDTSGKIRAEKMNGDADALEKQANQQIEDAQNALSAHLGAITALARDTRKGFGAEVYLAMVNEPDGKPEFAGNVTDPGYDRTLEYINTKLRQHDWNFQFGDKSKKFILLHPDGAYLMNLATLNPKVKDGSKDRRFRITLEMDRPDSTVTAIDKTGKADEKRILEIPCNDDVDSVEMAKAFSRLIAAAGGRKDPNFNQKDPNLK
jgi:hypothetical protein